MQMGTDPGFRVFSEKSGLDFDKLNDSLSNSNAPTRNVWQLLQTSDALKCFEEFFAEVDENKNN